MKKIAKYFFAALAVASAVSCAKELTDDYRPVDKVQQGESYTFTATMGDASKAVLDEYTYENLWMGDKDGNEYITVLEPAYFKNDTKVPSVAHTYVAGDIWEPVASAEFTAAEDKGILSKEIFAVYPEGEHTSFSGETEIEVDEEKVDVYKRSIEVVYPTTQTPTVGTYDPVAAVAVAYIADVEVEQNLRFQNVSSLLKLQLAESTEYVDQIKISALGGEKLSGKISLEEIDGEGAIVPDAAAVDHVILAGEFVKGATYYVAVAPALLEQGIAIQFNNDEVQTYTISREIEIERGKIYDLGVFACDKPENDWFLIGDYTVGNANTIRKTAFYPVEGENMLVARNVNIREGQGFKVHNPSTSETYYPEVSALPVDEWYPLTKVTDKVGYGYALATNETYDVYVDFIGEEGKEVMSGLILVEAGADVPEFAAPTMQLTTDIYGAKYAFDINEDALFIGKAPENDDPTTEGMWVLEYEAEDVVIKQNNAVSGEITFSMYDSWDDAEYDYLIKYSYDDFAFVFDSPAMQKVGDVEYKGLESLIWCNPTTWTAVEEELEFGYPYPTVGQFTWDVYSFEQTEEDEWIEYSYSYYLDLGVTEEGVVRYGYEYDDQWTDPNTGEYSEWADPYLCGKYYTEHRFDSYEVVPSSPTAGQIIVKSEEFGEFGELVIEYSNYTYNNSLSLFMADFIEDPETGGAVYAQYVYEPVELIDDAPSYKAFTYTVVFSEDDEETTDVDEYEAWRYSLDFDLMEEGVLTLGINVYDFYQGAPGEDFYDQYQPTDMYEYEIVPSKEEGWYDVMVGGIVFLSYSNYDGTGFAFKSDKLLYESADAINGKVAITTAERQWDGITYFNPGMQPTSK